MNDYDQPHDYAELSPEECKYLMHNEHHACTCESCLIFREQIR